MTRERVVTHVYRMPEGWMKVPGRRLTEEYAAELRASGFTMIRARRGLFDVKEKSLRW